MKNTPLLLLLSVALVGCYSSGESWSEEEKENAQHFLYSLESANAATTLSNEIGKGNQPKSGMEAVIKLRKNALEEAALVKDSVLRKAHDDLPEKFRNLYQRSLEYFIKAYEKKDNQASIRYSTLSEQWSDWYRRNKRNIRIPK